MAVSVADLIAKKETIEANKQALYDMETSIGIITIKTPSKALMTEALDLTTGNDEYLIFNSCVSPKLGDAQLQKAYKCAEPTDIVGKLFEPGEVVALSKKIMQLAGYGKTIAATIHEEAKN